MENDIFWSEIRSGFGEPGGTPPPRIPRSTLPPGEIQSRTKMFDRIVCIFFSRDSTGQALKPIWRLVLKCFGSGERIRGTKGRFVKK